MLVFHAEGRSSPDFVRITEMMEKEEPLWSRLACRMVMHVVTHPFDYAKVLIQIGYEPLEPQPTKTLFGNPALGLPNVFQYARYIKNVDGYLGCYRGFAPKLCAQAVSAVAFEKSIKLVVFEDEPSNEVPIDELNDEDRDKKYVQEYIKNIVARTVSIIVSHPFDVICVRMMAQFVGGETKYVTILGSFKEIYKENGILGYFSGIIPRLIASIATVTLVSTSTYIINKYFVTDREFRSFTSATMTFLASTITYPFLVVSQCMAVNNCGLTAGEPPMMPIYVDWTHCWNHLSSTKQLKRGSSLLWRYYTGPQITVGGRSFVDKSSLYLKKIN